jgi:NADH-quinone oxidoreductase subunit H
LLRPHQRLLVLGSLCVLWACTPQKGALLLELGEVTPRAVEVGDRLRITGSGFPEGRAATLVLVGDASRAGEPVTRGIEVSAEARLLSPHALEVEVTRELAAAICDRADPRHTTLRADLELRFASFRGPHTTVSGRLEGVTLDVTPESVSESTVTLLRQEGLRFAGFIGAEVARSEEGVTVTRVAERSRASRAGLAPGDVILELDGLSVHGLADFVPPPNLRTSRVVVRRGVETTTLNVDGAGFRFTSPASLANAAALALAAAFAFGLLSSPFGRLFGLFERRLVERLREAGERREKEHPLRAALSALSRELPTSLARHLALAAVTVVLVLVAFGQSVVASEIDVPALFLATVTGSMLVALGVGGAGTRPSVWAGVKRAGALLVHQLPLIAALVACLVVTGSFRAIDIVRAQGPWPWQWHLFSSPGLSLICLLALAAQVPLARPVRSLSPRGAVGWRERALDVAQWTHDLVVCGLLALVLLGGWAPGGKGSLGSDLAGAALLLAKAWALLLGIALARWTLGPTDTLRVIRWSAAWFVLPSALILAVSVTVRRFPAGAASGALDQRSAWALSLVLLLAVAWFLQRVLRQARHPATELRVLPWL